MSTAHETPADTGLAVAAATAAARVLPAVDPLTPAAPQPGTDQVTSGLAGAASAELDGPRGGRVTVLVAADLVEALASSPLGGLDLSAAVQPAVDAAAGALGCTARAAREVPLELVAGDMGGSFTVVPLLAPGPVAAVLVSDAALRPAAPAPVAGPGEPVVTAFPSLPTADSPSAVPAPTASRGIEMLHGVDMEVTVELGRTQMTVRDLLALSPGAVLELDRAAGSPADLLVNGRLIARGEVVVVDEDFGLRVTEIVEDAAAS